MNDKFSVAIKGILYHKGKYLLRKNQRGEFELLGGKLEKTDTSMKHRLSEEFLEESGISIKAHSPKEPWIYIVGKKNIIIIPFHCDVLNIPDTLSDEDGGELYWFSDSELRTLSIPPGYLDSIYGRVPHKSFSPFEGEYLKIIPDYVENEYEVIVSVKSLDNDLILEKPLKKFIAPRDFIGEYIKGKKIISEPPVIKGSKVFINYTAY